MAAIPKNKKIKKKNHFFMSSVIFFLISLLLSATMKGTAGLYTKTQT